MRWNLHLVWQLSSTGSRAGLWARSQLPTSAPSTGRDPGPRRRTGVVTPAVSQAREAGPGDQPSL